MFLLETKFMKALQRFTNPLHCLLCLDKGPMIDRPTPGCKEEVMYNMSVGLNITGITHTDSY